MAALLVLGLLGPPEAKPLAAQEEAAPGWIHERWTVEDGLPVDSVTDVLQSRNGYIWITTYDGLVRFDGVEMEVFQSAGHPGLPTNRLLRLWQDGAGGLWITTEQRELVRFADGRFRTLAPREGLPFGDAFAFHEDPDGTVWLGTDRGLARFREGRLEPVAPRTLTAPVREILRGPDGALWLGTDGGGVARLDADGTRRWTTADGLPSDRVESLAPRSGKGGSGAAGLWIGTRGGLALLRDGAVLPPPGGGVGGTTVFDLYPEPPEALWAGTDRGPLRLEHGRPGRRPGWIADDLPALHDVARHGPDEDLWVRTRRVLYRKGERVFTAPRAIQSILHDREGNLWIATATAGLHRLRPSPVTVYGEPEGLPEDIVYPVLEDGRGRIWIGTLGGGLARLEPAGTGTRIETFGPDDGLPSDVVWSLEEDSRGALWVGGYGLCRMAGSRCRTDGVPPELRRSTPVRALFEDARGRIWVGTRPETGAGPREAPAVYRRGEDGWRRFDADDGLPDAPVRVFEDAADGAVWMGTNGGGLVRFQDGRFDALTTADGLPSDLIRALHRPAKGPAKGPARQILWVGTEDRGLARVGILPGEPLDDARIAAVGEDDGLFDSSVHQILPDGRGRLWMSSNRGIFHVERSDLESFAAGHRERVRSTGYSERDGLRSREANGGVQPAGVRARDGRLWFPTQSGAVVIDPDGVERNPFPPPVVIEGVRAGGATVPIEDGVLRLGPERRDLEIEYTALSFVDPAKVRFRYRLEGDERGWVDAGGRRRAIYTNLPPGEHRFRVVAANDDGVWNRSGAALTITVEPRFAETPAFYALCGLGLLLSGAGAGLWRRRRLLARQAELEAEVAARTDELSRRAQDLERQKARTEEALETIERQAAALEELDEAKSRFFADVSHELRTPLTLLVGPLEEAVDGGGTLEGAEPTMLRNARRLQRMVDQILELQRLESGKLELHPEPVDVDAFVRETVKAFAPLAERRGIALSLHGSVEDALRRLDRPKAERILANLLSNALKFTPQGGTVTVRLEAGPGHEVRIAVADDGPGIPEADRRRLFERFYQAEESHSGRHGGMGIGLALSRELARLHGGDVEVESAPGEGSTFTVRLPLEPVDEPAQRTEAPAAEAVPAPERPRAERSRGREPDRDRSPDRTTVLVVDDHADVRTFVRRILEPGFRVLEAADGATGLETARDRLPDLVVADVAMPRMDGFALVRALRREPATECIPVVFLTARAAAADEVVGFESGADAYVVKPFSPAALGARVEALLANRRRLRERLRAEAARGQDTRPVGPGPPRSRAPRSLEHRLRAVVRERLHDDELTVEALARAVHLSRSQLHRRLQDEAGVTPSALLRSVRLDRAAELLAAGAGSVSEVAYAVGFKSLSHFSRAFAERFGVAPSEYPPTRG